MLGYGGGGPPERGSLSELKTSDDNAYIHDLCFRPRRARPETVLTVQAFRIGGSDACRAINFPQQGFSADFTEGRGVPMPRAFI